MPDILNAVDKIPLMFRAQTKGRSQLQFIADKTQQQDSERWVSEWTERVYPYPPELGINGEQDNGTIPPTQTKTYTFSWRFVTNGGQDEGIIRPVLGAYGLPFYPGSSMKGAFCQACTQEQKQRYRLTKNGDEPSLLRFHGGYPINDWTENLLDIVHPQQGWQVKTNNTRQRPGGESGFALISLWQPTFTFGISSLIPDTDWDEVWQIWEKALGYGLGCRVSSGYGLPKARLNQQGEIDTEIKVQGNLLYKCYLQGRGPAPHLIDGEISEFRPNIFRAALRGHALRIFGGLTNEKTADALVDTIFGGIQEEAKQGLLAIAFKESSLSLGEFTDGYNEPTYDVKGELSWLLTQRLEETQQEGLKKLIRLLMRFSMLLGGFGKTWRRADHRLFYEDYYQQKKPLIGCHWQWDKRSLVSDNTVRSLNHVAPFIESLLTAAKEWMNLQGVSFHPNETTSWRERWHPNIVQVWGRIAEDKEDSQAILWFHKSYQQGASIKGSSLTGSISQISRIWHRMYPIVNLVTDPNSPDGKKIPKKTTNYLELLTVFPDDSAECQEFIEFLEHKAQRNSDSSFKLLWPK